MINFLVQLATDGVYRKHFFTRLAVFSFVPPFDTATFCVTVVRNIQTIQVLSSSVLHRVQLYLLLLLEILPFSVTQPRATLALSLLKMGQSPV